MPKFNFSEQKILRIYWILFASPIIILTILFLLIANGLMGFMPTFEDLENPSSNIATEVYSEDGAVLGSFFIENRSNVRFDELSQNIINAIIAIEDNRFEKHSGIDQRGLTRVFFKTVLLGDRESGGGSTLTQQLAKNLFGRDTTTYNSSIAKNFNLGLVKFKEWVTAVRLERNYTKKEILVMYLNTVFYGGNSFGIKSASKTFFNTTPDSLNIEQAALLAGIINAPTRYNPIRQPERARLRRNIVLGQMNKYGFITDEEFDSLSVLPIVLDYNIQDHNFGLAPHFREFTRMTLTAKEPSKSNYSSYLQYKIDSAEWVDNPAYGWINKNLKPDGNTYNIYKDGLKIHTTINSSMQEYAEKGMEEHLGGVLQNIFFKEKKGKSNAPFSNELTTEQRNNILNNLMRDTDRYRALRESGASEDEITKSFRTKTEMTIFTWEGEKDTAMTPLDSIIYYLHIIRAGVMSMDPSTGYVKAYVGGLNYKYFKYDHVTMGKRQVGSTIKPFLYTLAMQEGFSPCHKVPCVPQTFQVNDTTWTPRNSNDKYEGEMVSLMWGLANSDNWVTAWIMKQLKSPQAVVDLMRRMGVKSYIDPVYSMILGTPEISLAEMVGAYGTFVNKGVYVKPIYITRIEDKNGNTIAEFQKTKEEAISEATAYQMVSLLENVINRGTGVSLRFTYNMKGVMGGKTGTTQNNSDGWFMGITPHLVTGVWVGAMYRSINFDAVYYGQGARMAMPIWAKYMQAVYADKSLGYDEMEPFAAPESGAISYDCKESNNDAKENWDDIYVNTQY